MTRAPKAGAGEDSSSRPKPYTSNARRKAVDTPSKATTDSVKGTASSTAAARSLDSSASRVAQKSSVKATRKRKAEVQQASPQGDRPPRTGTRINSSQSSPYELAVIDDLARDIATLAAEANASLSSAKAFKAAITLHARAESLSLYVKAKYCLLRANADFLPDMTAATAMNIAENVPADSDGSRRESIIRMTMPMLTYITESA